MNQDLPLDVYLISLKHKADKGQLTFICHGTFYWYLNAICERYMDRASKFLQELNRY